MNELLRPMALTCPPVVQFGPGTVAAVGRWAEVKDLRWALVVTGASNARCVHLLGLSGEVTVFDEVEREPSVPNLERLLATAEDIRPDLVVGFRAAAPWALPSSLLSCPAAARRSST
jgi:alcohol dehydrogenase